jgi:hypothetical protein
MGIGPAETGQEARAMKKTFHAVRVSTVPGIELLRLNAPWRHDEGTLPAGTEVRPISVITDRDGNMKRKVSVFRTGKTIVGPY